MIGTPRSEVTAEQSRREYLTDGFVGRRRMVDPELCAFLANYLMLLGERGSLTVDRQVEHAASAYGDPAFDVLLNGMTDMVEDHVGAPLTPSYSFARVYFAGAELRRHRDRPACEHSVTLHLGSTGGMWPLFIEDLHGRTVEVHQEVGDGLCYRGMELDHWREPLRSGVHAQVFLHWVRADGPHAAHAYDQRAGLGRPPVARDGRS